MRTLTDAFVLGALSIALAACSGDPAPEPLADAAADATDSAPTDTTDRCQVAPGVLPAAQAECEPCRGRTFIEGLSCGDLSVGFQCEVGDHPTWVCNDIWECDPNHEWRRISIARASVVCSPKVVQGIACDPFLAVCPRKSGVACMDENRSHVSVFGGELEVLNLEPHTRFGCPCTRPDLERCGFAEVCVEGSWRRKETAPCIPQ